MGTVDSGKAVKVSYQTPDGINLCGIITGAIKGRSKGEAVFAHGLNNNKDEDGYFVRLSRMLSKAGYSSLRFDFRGHGESSGRPEDMTVTGELVDLKTSIAYLEGVLGDTVGLVLVASSFGAPAVILYAAENKDKVEKLVLLNPVLDFRKTFLQSETEWGKTFFNPTGYKELESKGFISIPETEFRLGRRVIEDFGRIEPYKVLQELKMPILTIHGTQDTSVPYEVSRKYGAPNSRSKFISLDTDHTFPGKEDFVVQETFRWLTEAR
ncbi:MAG TPA: alpha/beta fold hydrolase [Nitrososphaerales archaeon]|nr:alpha/beta fold hydrolase [Nitrososphaerales archaeon]